MPITTTTQPQINNHTHKVVNNQISLDPSDFCCFKPCIGLVNMICQIMNTLANCCLRPCCSGLAVMGGLATLGVVILAMLFAVFFGFIPVPNQITQTICNNTRENFYYRENFTIYKQLDSNKTLLKLNNKFNNNNKNLSQNLNIKNKTSNLATHLNKTLSSKPTSIDMSSVDDVMSHLIREKMNKVLGNQKTQRNRISKFIALQYDILLLPNLSEGGEENNRPIYIDNFIGSGSSSSSTKKSYGMEMKINIDVKLVCNYSTEFLYFSTREFSNIELK